MRGAFLRAVVARGGADEIRRGDEKIAHRRMERAQPRPSRIEPAYNDAFGAFGVRHQRDQRIDPFTEVSPMRPHANYPVAALCEMVSVSKGGFHACKLRPFVGPRA